MALDLRPTRLHLGFHIIGRPRVDTVSCCYETLAGYCYPPTIAVDWICCRGVRGGRFHDGFGYK